MADTYSECHYMSRDILKNVVEIGSVVERVGNKYIARRQHGMKQLHGLHFDFATDVEIAVWRKHCHLAK